MADFEQVEEGDEGRGNEEEKVETTEKKEKQIYDHPIYKEISLTNGKINKMKKEEVKKVLNEFGLDSRGVKEVLQKRLKTYLKKEKLRKAKIELEKKRKIHYYCVIDFEATCEKENPQDYKHEIIEFPAVLVDGSTLEVVDIFHQYCRPVLKPILTEFCQELTGITQDVVDNSMFFGQVLDEFHIWLKKHELGTKHKMAVVTDGPWDIARFLVLQCEISNIMLPKWSKRWINLRKHYRNYYKTRCKLIDMLENLGLHFEGRPHCGLDDSKNIARIMIKMIQDGWEPEFNESLG
ncbi:3'-5' exoribonuclease 1 [Exaiptasia diaphana]|uniref:3'-5' exoribonuclease 1 n=1 Tax=Exaiptasia diaphana TaxID=2652724 RepID=A0A913XHR6_EXADI|nr:3'-5' exoribonuclease 1 [Exaiptasia diaphana]KXJ11780.1 3'-5' exoribonuclease 1 [Exaiptasia diaphana]